MNKNQKIALGMVAGTLILKAVVDTSKTVRHERKLRKEIEQSAAEDIAALRVAGARVQERINAGKKYNTWKDVKNDLQFELIIEREF